MFVISLFEHESLGEALTGEKRLQYCQEWTALSATKEVLRVWKEEHIRVLPEDHYDALILETVEKLHKKQRNKEYIFAAQVVGEIVAGMDELIEYFFLEYRIRQLVHKRHWRSKAYQNRCTVIG